MRTSHFSCSDPSDDEYRDSADWRYSSDFIAHLDGPLAGIISHGCEGADGVRWTPAQARVAAQKLMAMADLLEHR